MTSGGEVIKEDVFIQDIKKPAKDFDPIKATIKSQIKFDEVASTLGSIIIITYLAIIAISFLLSVFNLCENCYPSYLERFETLVLIITGFFFGTKLITQYLPSNRK